MSTHCPLQVCLAVLLIFTRSSTTELLEDQQFREHIVSTNHPKHKFQFLSCQNASDDMAHNRLLLWLRQRIRKESPRSW
jgi:hypothetical protein